MSGLAGEVTGWSLGLALGAVAAVRRGKAVHPDGVVHEASLVVSGSGVAPQGATLLSQPGEHRALVRFSRSLGVPRPLPDLLGLSIRVIDAYGSGRHQDFLLVTSADYPVLHHVFLPAYDWQQRPYSSSLPYRSGGETFLVGAIPAGTGSTERPSFDLAVASLSGRFEPVAELRVGGRLPAELDALRFNPLNTGGGMELVGFLNHARDRAYRLSQAAWRRTLRDGADKQDAAERRLLELGNR